MAKRIYSLNLATYLKMKGYEYEIHEDKKKNIKYFVFKDDLTDEINNYKNNKELQSFICNFKEIKKELRDK